MSQSYKKGIQLITDGENFDVPSYQEKKEKRCPIFCIDRDYLISHPNAKILNKEKGMTPLIFDSYEMK